MTRETLHFTVKAHDLDLPEESIDKIARVFHDLNVFDNVADAMSTLDAAGYDVYVLSNGEPDLLKSRVERAASKHRFVVLSVPTRSRRTNRTNASIVTLQSRSAPQSTAQFTLRPPVEYIQRNKNGNLERLGESTEQTLGGVR